MLRNLENLYASRISETGAPLHVALDSWTAQKIFCEQVDKILTKGASTEKKAELISVSHDKHAGGLGVYLYGSKAGWPHGFTLDEHRSLDKLYRHHLLFDDQQYLMNANEGFAKRA